MKPNIYPIMVNHKITGVGIQYTDKNGKQYDLQFDRAKGQIINTIEFQDALKELKGVL